MQTELDRLDTHWQAERDALTAIVESRAALLDDEPSHEITAAARADIQARLAAAQQALAEMQGDEPIVPPAGRRPCRRRDRRRLDRHSARPHGERRDRRPC
ncbi:hypothetical protein ACP26O_28670 [Burkholderia sp. R-40]|uniref:hypothetical protein n=1 Tax=Burkholderia sp. R-40 TaxID=3416709 RepID=UPI003CF2E05D